MHHMRARNVTGAFVTSSDTAPQSKCNRNYSRNCISIVEKLVTKILMKAMKVLYL